MQSLAPDRRIGDRYVLLERIASGGHAAIWRARDSHDDSIVALKILHPALAGSPEAWGVLQREHLMTQRLDHPGILATQPPGRDGDVVFLAMEYAAGGDLRRLRGQSYLRIVPVLIEIAAALSHAHEHGVVHRDLKPGNVLFDAHGKVKLADFGAADFAGSTTALASGSPFSASPQQLRNEPAAPADDIYGLGALAYELLSGYPPYYPEFDLEHARSAPPAKLVATQPAPVRLVALIEAMLARDPADRPASMAQIVEALYQSLSDTLELEEPAQVNAVSAFALTGAAVEDLDADAPDDEPAALQSVPPSEPATRTVVIAPPAAVEAAPSPARTLVIPPPPADEGMVSVAPAAAASPPPRRAMGPARRIAWLRQPSWRGWLAFAVLAALALAAILALPRLVDRPDAPRDGARGAAQVADAPPAAAPAATEETATQARDEFRNALAALEARQAGAWGGESFAAARGQGDAAQRELDAGRFADAQQRFQAAQELLKPVAGSADGALRAELARGAAAIEAGQSDAARAAYERAARIQPDNAAVRQGLRDAGELETALQVMSAGARAESDGNGAQALKLYEQAVQATPQFRAAREARDRLRGSLAQNDYERAVAVGFDALRGERYAEARAAFKRALALRGDSDAARGGMAQVDAALAAQDFGALRQQAAGLEAAERWEDALAAYERVLGMDPTLRFARQGRDRAEERVALSRQLDRFITEPQRLAALEVSEEAAFAVRRAQMLDAPGPVLRSQIARVQILLEDFGRPVRVALESDNTTQISIARIGSLGAFTRRDLELKPGRYTVIGTRAGFRDVRRDIMLAPGQSTMVVQVLCTERI